LHITNLRDEERDVEGACDMGTSQGDLMLILNTIKL
jgi:hypothetical protein